MRTLLFILACNFSSIFFFVLQLRLSSRSKKKWIRWNDEFAKAMRDRTAMPLPYKDFK